MSIFICPNCEQRSEIDNGDETRQKIQVCPSCGHAFTVDQDLNLISEE